MNSYLGYLKHFRSDKVADAVVGVIHNDEWAFDRNKRKIVLKINNHEEEPNDFELEATINTMAFCE